METLQYFIYFTMQLVYTTILIEKFKIKFGLIISFFISALLFILIVYLIPILPNIIFFNEFVSFILSISAIILGIVVLGLIKILGPYYQFIRIGDKPYYNLNRDVALNKLKSSNLEEKKLALDYLIQIPKDDIAFYGLCDALSHEKDILIKDLFIKYICLMNEQRGNKWNNFG